MGQTVYVPPEVAGHGDVRPTQEVVGLPLRKRLCRSLTRPWGVCSAEAFGRFSGSGREPLQDFKAVCLT